ncbi:MAG: hypothetical protein WB643_12635 [Candidatus Bathyarchaeia archaeon]
MTYPSLAIYGQFLGVVFTIGGIFQGLRIQTINLSKAITATTNISATAKIVAHEPECAAYENSDIVQAEMQTTQNGADSGNVLDNDVGWRVGREQPKQD